MLIVFAIMFLREGFHELWHLAETWWEVALFVSMVFMSAAVTLLSGAAFGWCMWAVMERQYRKNAAGQRRCSECGYHLKGVDEPRCPECGHGSTDAHNAHESQE